MKQEENGEYLAGKKLTHEITRAGFSINEKKTRIQYKDSRQDVTGLIVNKKPNVKKEYWRTVKSQCNRLFQTGAFNKKIYKDDQNG
jgi:retron-type reverse transcriptase